MVPSTKQLILGASALVVGSLVYVLDRPASSVYFVPEALSLYSPSASVFGPMGNHLPTFFHVVAFALLTSGAAGCRSLVCLAVAVVGWTLVDGLFELAQYDAVAESLVRHIPTWFQHVPVLDNTRAYLLRGEFDPRDLASIAVGGMSAFALGWWTLRVPRHAP